MLNSSGIIDFVSEKIYLILKNIIVLAALMIVITGIFSFARYKMIKLK